MTYHAIKVRRNNEMRQLRSIMCEMKNDYFLVSSKELRELRCLMREAILMELQSKGYLREFNHSGEHIIREPILIKDTDY